MTQLVQIHQTRNMPKIKNMFWTKCMVSSDKDLLMIPLKM